MSDKEKEKSGDEQAQDFIRKVRHGAGYRGKDVEPLSTRKKKKKVVKEDLGAAAKLAYDVATHPLTPIAIRALRKKFKKKKKRVEESSRGVARIVRRVRAGHLSKDAPTVKQKEKDQEERYKEREAGGDPDERPKNVKGRLAAMDRGIEDTGRPPSQYKTRTKAQIDHASDTRIPHVVKAVRRAHSRSIGTFVPGRDQAGTVSVLAQQKKESPTLSKDIADKAKAYRRIRRSKVPPSMN